MHQQNNEEEALLGAAISDEEKYKDCERFRFKCPECQKEIIMDNVFNGTVSHPLYFCAVSVKGWSDE